MTAVASNNLGRTGISQLLRRIGSTPVQEPGVACEVFDWRQSHYFTEAQLKTIREVLKSFVETTTTHVGALCQTEFTVEVMEVTQHYASELLDVYGEDEAGHLFHAFGPTQEDLVGLLLLEVDTARTWAQWLLGPMADDEEVEPGLTPLELSLLNDVTSAVIESWDATHESINAVSCAEGVQEGLAVAWDRASHLCRIRWTLKPAVSEEKTHVAFVLPCSVLAPLVGRELNMGSALEDENRQMIMGHLNDYPVLATVALGSTKLSFQEIMSLKVQDVLVLDRCIDEPIDVMVAGQPAFKAKLGKSNGQQAVLLTAAGSA